MKSSDKDQALISKQNIEAKTTLTGAQYDSNSMGSSNSLESQTQSSAKLPALPENNSNLNDPLHITMLQNKTLLQDSATTNVINHYGLPRKLSKSMTNGELNSSISQSIVELDSTDTNKNNGLDENEDGISEWGIDISEDDIPISDPEDDFISSDGDSVNRVLSGQQFNSFGCGSTFSEHVLYFEKALDSALDLHQLDKSLVAQAKLSGQLNDTNRILIEKLQELKESLQRLRDLFNYHIVSKRIDNLDADLREINIRIRNLQHGSPKSLFFGKSKLGVMDRYPVEYNQARDKVLERPEDP